MDYKRKVLLCAYACEPYKGSEPAVGWETATHLARVDSTTKYVVITRANNQPTIEAEELPKNLYFIYYDLPTIFLYLKRKGNLARTYYYFWMLGAVLKLWGKRNEFHIIHHVTFVNDWLPSIFILLKTKRNYFIWGSIGSHDPVPSKFLSSTKEKIIESCRILLQKMVRSFDVFFSLCKLKSDIIIGINHEVAKKIKLSQKQCHKFTCIPAIAVKQEHLNYSHNEQLKSKKFKIISVGRLMYIKNFRLALYSYSIFLNSVPLEKRTSIEMIIIGDGQQLQTLKSYVEKLGVSDNVIFKGHIPQDEVMSNFKASDLFLFPTLESAGFVVLEAMTYALPIVALNYGGPKQFIKEGSEQQLVSPEGNFNEIAQKLSNKITDIYNDPELQIKLGIKNQESLRALTWRNKVNDLLTLYKELR